MKILIVHDYQDYVFGYFEPLGLMYLMAAARKSGHHVKIAADNFEEVCSIMEKWEPEFVGYGPYTGFHQNLIDFNRRLKARYSFTSIFGGPHATFFPEMVEYEDVDIVCRGEGEEVIQEVLGRAEAGENLSTIKNLWLKQNGKIIKNEVRPLESDLSKYDFPARDIFYHFKKARLNKIKLVITARGCPYSCTYCYNYKFRDLYKVKNSEYVRFRTVDSVIREIGDMREKYPLEFIYFATDCFTARKDWVLEFCEKYRAHKFPRFIAAARPETINPEICRALKSANCVSLAVGIESGDEGLRNTLLNRNMSDMQIIKAAECIHNAGLKLLTLNIFGFPGETFDQAVKTMEINQKCKTDLMSSFLFQPYPRTKLAEFAVEKGYFSGNYDHLSSSWFMKSPLENPEKEKIDRLHKLSALGAEFPALTKIFLKATDWKLDKFYFLLMRLYKAYSYRMRIIPVKIGFKNTVRMIWDYMTDFSK